MSIKDKTNSIELSDLLNVLTKALCWRKDCKQCSMTDCCDGYDKHIGTGNTLVASKVTE